MRSEARSGNGRRTRMTSMVAAALLIVSAGLVPSVANAHSSSYCSHKNSGVITITSFQYQYRAGRNANYNHIHVYKHWTYDFLGRVELLHPNTHKVCNGTH